MKKSILLLLTLCVCGIAQAAIFYISPTGNDVTGTGSISAPWRTVYKGCTSTTAGDVIRVLAGTYLETQILNLPIGVSLEGDGQNNTIIQSAAANGINTAMLDVTTNGARVFGNQYIANIKFDGRYVSESNKGNFWGINVSRSNVTIRNCTITGFYDRGVLFVHRADWGSPWVESVPSLADHAVNNKFHDNILTNSSTFYPGYGTGCLNIGGQKDMLIYNNTIQQNERVIGKNGWPIKQMLSGSSLGMKAYNNRIIKIPWTGAYNSDLGWNFAWEAYEFAGCEFYNNYVEGGSFDFNDNWLGPGNMYTYCSWIHDNVFAMPAMQSSYHDAIKIEFDSPNLLIENNIMYNFAAGITYSTRANTQHPNNIIRNNLMYNLGRTQGNGNNGTGIGIYTEGTADADFSNLQIYNNTIIARAGMAPWFGIDLSNWGTGSVVNGVYVKNNIVQGFYGNWLWIDRGASITTAQIQYNNTLNNGNGNAIRLDNGTPSGYVANNNTSNAQGFVNEAGGNYTLAAGSANIDAGTNVGLPYSGAAPDKGYKEFASGGNVAPTANAGADQTITLPTSSVTLTGSGTDPDGTIASYGWTKVSGPAGGTIASPATASTNITGLTAGIYVFRLTVTDNNGATATNDVQVTVIGAANQSPTANAGPDQTITLPTSSVTLTGSGTDPDGTIASYAWTKVSGPAGGTIASPAAASTNITGLTAGTYVFRITVTDNGGATAFDDVQIIVNSAPLPPPNQAPTANAGPDQTITLPTSSVTLTGSGTDPDGTIASSTWTKVSGPAGGTIASPAAASTNITGLTAGTYVFRITVTDNGGATAFDDVQIIVNSAPLPPPNQAPTANAGPDQTITLPTSSVTLTGSGTDPDGTIASYAWTKVSGPAGGTIASPAAASTNITGLTAGTYVFRITVTDNGGATAFDDVQIIVNSAPLPPPNQAPTANAGPDQTITLPTSSVTLTGSGTDPDGTIASYAWTKVSGPAGGTIASPAAASTNITGLTAGTYVFRITVTDNGGATAFDDVQIIVNSVPLPPPNQAPTANAGPDQTITLPTSSVTLTGSGTDPDGTIASSTWTKVSGPAGGTIASPAAASTNITGLTAGTYVFRITVTDNGGASASDDVQIIVNTAAAPIPPPNVAPTAYAGANQSITLPTSSVTLTGSGTDTDGTIAAYAWTKVSGPTAGTIASPSAASTSVSGLTAGTYIFRLTVTDNSGATAVDDVEVIVNNAPTASNIPPISDAGTDVSLMLPDNNTARLNGNNSKDPDGFIAGWSWNVVQGPAGSTITNSTSATPSLTVSRKGTYTLELMVTDNGGLSSKSQVKVIVGKVNKSPRAMTTYDTSTVKLPVQNTLLEGSNSYDVDGAISSYQWSYVSGPSTYNILTPDSANTVVSNLKEGTYQFELAVTDEDSAIDKKTVTIIVKNSTSRLEILDVKLYPNPAVNNVNVTINSDVQGRSTLKLFDVRGTVVYSEIFEKTGYSFTRNIKVSNLRKGTYFIVVQVDGSTRMVRKLVIQ